MPCLVSIRRYCSHAIKLAAAMLVTVAAAHAGTYEFSYASATDLAAISGDVFVTTTDATAGSPSLALSITGVRNGVPVTMLSAYASSDQLLYAVAPLVDFSGISFSTATAGDFNLFSSGGSYYEVSSAVDPAGYGWSATPINLTVSAVPGGTAVPEPTSLALFSVGFVGLCALLYRRRHAGTGSRSQRT